MLGVTHPTLWKFIDGLKRCQKLRDVEIEQLIAGRQPPAKKTMYVLRDARIERIVRDYANRAILDYLRGLSHNIRHSIVILNINLVVVDFNNTLRC